MGVERGKLRARLGVQNAMEGCTLCGSTKPSEKGELRQCGTLSGR